MAKHYVLGLMAANRCGILAAVSTALAELSGNIRDIRLTVVENFFTMILSADFPDQRDPGVIVGHLEGVGRPFGLSVLLRDPVAEQVPAVPPHDCQVFQLTLTGNDPPGVLARFSARLAREQIDITDMYGWRSGEESPVILLELAIPTHVNVAELRAELTAIGQGFGLETRLDFVRAGATRDPRPLRTRLPTGSQPLGER
ncbi:MAG: glycine cleavage system protein R [Planctomycetaceae bacterium]|jgi:glycine cleavage system transcriptional repressor